MRSDDGAIVLKTADRHLAPAVLLASVRRRFVTVSASFE
jgi:hypothetical protein